jgi:hypothetical protein
MDEYAWNISDPKLVRQRRQDLEKIHDGTKDLGTPPKAPRYSEIFSRAQLSEVGEPILKFVGERTDNPKDFYKQFDSLLKGIGKRSRNRALENAKTTDSFPKKPFSESPIYLFILYATSIFYCLARFVLIALAFSCLRAMPDTVYDTTWAGWIPAL